MAYPWIEPPCLSPSLRSSYARGMLDYHVVVDLLPVVARLFFTKRLPVALSYLQVWLRTLASSPPSLQGPASSLLKRLFH